MKVSRNRQYLEFTDADGCRHLVKIASIQWLSDFDGCRNETWLTATGRTIHIPVELDVVRAAIEHSFGRDASWEPHGANITGNGMPPSRTDVRTMAAQSLIKLFEVWLRDGTNASSPTKEVVSDLLSELEARPDRDAFAGFIVRQKKDFGID